MRLRATSLWGRSGSGRGLPILMAAIDGPVPTANGDGSYTWRPDAPDNFHMRFMPGLPSPSGLYEVYFQVFQNTLDFGLALDMNDTDTLNLPQGYVGEVSLMTRLPYQWFDFYSGSTVGLLRMTMPVMRKVLGDFIP